MDTVSHGAWTYLITHRHPKTWIAVVGAMLPDVPLMGIAMAMLLEGKLSLTPPWLVKIYTLPGTLLIDSIFHSIVLWTIVLAISILLRWEKLRWLVYGVFFHIGIDIVTHTDFIPKYFFPLSSNGIAGVVEYRTLRFTVVDVLLLVTCLGVYLFSRHYKKR